MTQMELELATRQIRSKCLHYSWNELLALTKDIIESLTEAYYALGDVEGAIENKSKIQASARNRVDKTLKRLTSDM